MMNALDFLLEIDEAKLKRPSKEVEIKRLSEVFGEKFIVKCEALSPDKFDEIQEQAMKISGKDVDIDVNEMQIFTLIEGVKNVSGETIFKNKDLQKKLKAPTPKELVNKILLSGEISQLYNIISDLSGFGDKAIEEVKN